MLRGGARAARTPFLRGLWGDGTATWVVGDGVAIPVGGGGVVIPVGGDCAATPELGDDDAATILLSWSESGGDMGSHPNNSRNKRRMIS